MSRAEKLPQDIAIRLCAARDAIVGRDYDEAYHQIYMIAESFAHNPFKPWVQLEQMAAPQEPAK